MNNLKLEKENYTIFTVCNLAYLSKALVLAESVSKHTNIRLNIFLFDKKINTDFSALDANIYWLEEMNIPNFYSLAFKYDITEFSTSLKPYITLELLKTYEKIIFLDPDTYLYHSPNPILEDLDRHSIILTPHYTTPQSDSPTESDLGMMRFGSFNLGFYAIKKSEQGFYFLKWWHQRCIDFCYMESQFGLSTDQKWVSIAPCFFKDLYVSFNLGYNFAPWNTWERKLTKDSQGNYLINDKEPLVFFHFSNFDTNDTSYLNKRSLRENGLERSDLLALGNDYKNRLIAKTEELVAIRSVKYAFDYMSGGEYISPTLRVAYASILRELPESHDPFDSTGIIGDFARKNHLFQKNNTPYNYIKMGLQEVESHKTKLKIIYFSMRILLRFIGPNKFHNLSRLLVYLSSYRQNRALWKY